MESLNLEETLIKISSGQILKVGEHEYNCDLRYLEPGDYLKAFFNHNPDLQEQIRIVTHELITNHEARIAEQEVYNYAVFFELLGFAGQIKLSSIAPYLKNLVWEEKYRGIIPELVSGKPSWDLYSWMVNTLADIGFDDLGLWKELFHREQSTTTNTIFCIIKERSPELARELLPELKKKVSGEVYGLLEDELLKS